MPKRFSTLRVSMVCKTGTSTRNSECSGLKGMLVGVDGVERSCWGAVCGGRRVLWCTRTSGIELGWAVGKCCVSGMIGR